MRWRWRAARGCDVQLDWRAVPLLAGVRALAAQGFVTGASGRNWAGYGARHRAAGRLRRRRPGAADRPADQRRPAGGLRAGALDAVLAVFRRHGFEAAAVVGGVLPRTETALQVLG